MQFMQYVHAVLYYTFCLKYGVLKKHQCMEAYRHGSVTAFLRRYKYDDLTNISPYCYIFMAFSYKDDIIKV